LAAGGRAPREPGTFSRGNEFLCGSFTTGSSRNSTWAAAISRRATPPVAPTRVRRARTLARACASWAPSCGHAAALFLDHNLTTLDARGPADGETGQPRYTRQNAVDSAAGISPDVAAAAAD